MSRKKVSKAERRRRSEAASMLGRLGARKGGLARAASMTRSERRALASSGGKAFAALSGRARSEAALKGWATRRKAESERASA